MVRTTGGTGGNKETGSVGMMVKDVEMVMFGWMEAENFYRIFIIVFIKVELQDIC